MRGENRSGFPRCDPRGLSHSWGPYNSWRFIEISWRFCITSWGLLTNSWRLRVNSWRLIEISWRPGAIGFRLLRTGKFRFGSRGDWRLESVRRPREALGHARGQQSVPNRMCPGYLNAVPLRGGGRVPGRGQFRGTGRGQFRGTGRGQFRGTVGEELGCAHFGI